jgi:hypothetical protein
MSHTSEADAGTVDAMSHVDAVLLDDGLHQMF